MEQAAIDMYPITIMYHRSKSWPVAALLLMASVGATTNARAQQFEPPQLLNEDDVRDIPFGVEQLLAPRWRLANGPHVRAAFREVVSRPSSATVHVWASGKRVALGGIIDGDGWIITKASQLAGKLNCQLADGRNLAARMVSYDGAYDVALLKVDAANLPNLEFGGLAAPPVGSFVATVGPGGDPVAVGVVSVGPRAIPPLPGILGVQLPRTNNDPLVMGIDPGSGAERAGLKEGDRITNIEGQPIVSGDQLKRTVRRYNPGDRIAIEVDRDGESIELSAILSGRFNSLLPRSRSQFQNDLGGKLSLRRFGFPRAFQHDTVLDPNQCGGPLVNLDGEVVGINIARAGRTESYAFSSASLVQLIDRLKAEGELTTKAEGRATAVTAP